MKKLLIITTITICACAAFPNRGYAADWIHPIFALEQAYDDNVFVYQWDGFYSGNRFYKLYTKSTAFQNMVLKYWIVRNAPLQ